MSRKKQRDPRFYRGSFFAVSLHNVFFCAIVNHTNAHFFMGGDRKIRDAQRIELRAQAQLRVQPEIVHRFSQRLFFGHNHHPVFSMPGCACSMQFALAGRYDMCYANKHEIVFM